MELPRGLVTRPLVLADAPAVTAVMAAEELADIGEVAIEEADIVGDWQRPSFDLATSTIGVFDGTQLVGYAERSGAGRGDAAVHPDHHGRGIGTFLAGWLQDTARAAGDDVIGVPVPQGSPGDRLLTALGFRVRWTSWVLELPPEAEIPARPLPAGYAVREAAPTEHESVWTVIEDAFLEWSVRPRQSFADFTAGVMDRPGFAPWNLRVVTGPDGDVVGAAFVVLASGCGFVDRLAVRGDQRNRGLATALLVDAFAAARANGAERSELSTDSRTGALGLYENVGMQVTSTWLSRAADL
ncbi:MAG: GNAT family N-acetyltransferase [Nocardioides sp.]